MNKDILKKTHAKDDMPNGVKIPRFPASEPAIRNRTHNKSNLSLWITMLYTLKITLEKSPET